MNTAWPRAAVYDPGPGTHWYLHYFSLLFLAAAGIAGATAYRLAARHRASITPEVVPA